MEKPIEKVSLVGMGFVGLTTAAFFASGGISVTGIDIDAEKIRKMKEGFLPFYEEDLEPLLKSMTQKGMLKLVTDYEPTIAESDMTMIAVGTPCDDDGHIDLKFIRSAAQSIGRALKQKDDWHLVHVTWNASSHTYSIYVNGSLENESTDTNVDTGSGTITALNIGRRAVSPAARYHVGELDEIRIINTTKSTGWITTEYNNTHMTFA